MLFSIAIIFCLFVVTSVGATGSSSPATGAASIETRHPKPGEIVEVWSVSLKYDPVSCHCIPRSPSQTLLAFYSTSMSILRRIIVWQFL